MNFTDAYLALDNLYEAKRIISNEDILYHYTNPTPLLKIFREECLRGDVHLKAVCLTTDKDYVIYGYPCGIQLSRKKLTQAGYELIKFDEFEDDPDSAGESEERIYGNIDNISRYTEAIYINWENISVVQSADGDRIADAVYDEFGNENETYDLMLSDFKELLAALEQKGIKIIEKGSPMYGEYYLDINRELQYGKMPNSAAV